jgi:YD repeat-containing protein
MEPDMAQDVQNKRQMTPANASRILAKRVALAASFLLIASTAWAQTVNTPEDEYKKLIKVNEDIQPLGDTPFGERISLYDGSLSFAQTDISVPGNGPTITVGREFVMHGIEDRPDLQDRAFGNWDISLPQIFTVTANQSNVKGWLVGNPPSKAICTRFDSAPSVAGPNGDSARADWEPAAWWQGYQLRIPGQGSQDLLERTPGNTTAPSVLGLVYPIVTKGNWSVGCLGQASNDATIQAFLAVAPDGTKYWLDHIAYRYMPSIQRPLGSGPLSLIKSSQSIVKPMALDVDMLQRREGRMLVTRVEDRFGNYISYSYSGDLVTDIIGSDGRHVSIAYQAGTPRISSITILAGNAPSRTWTYSYVKSSTNPVYSLTTVRQPDGSVWSYGFDQFNNAAVDTRDVAGDCQEVGTPSNVNTEFGAWIIHPSGLTANYTVKALKRGRSGVLRNCMAGTGQAATPHGVGTWASIPNASWGLGITRRVLTGAGIDKTRPGETSSLTWDYSYSTSNESWFQDCASCIASVYTDVAYPDGHSERSTFSNRYDWTESQLQREDAYDGAVGSALRRSTTYEYTNPDTSKDSGLSAAYMHPWGWAPQGRINNDQLEEQSPLRKRTIFVYPTDGGNSDAYWLTVAAFDAFARSRDVTRSSSLGYAVSERSTFQDDVARWVIGLPLQTDNLKTDDLSQIETVSRNVYDSTTLTLSERYRFGRKVMGYGFNASGQLTSFTDGNGKTTQFDQYYRGIPRSIRYPDGKSQSITVDDLGQITAITNQAGDTTSYGYDAVGRLGAVSYPQGDTTSWNGKTYTYDYVTGSERGVAANHWRRTVRQGDRIQQTYFDALLRPVLTDVYRASDGGLRVSSRTDYDWQGQKSFVSYPYNGSPLIGSMSEGTRTVYDGIGRPVASTQTSEQGDLTTSTAYISAGARQVTDPKGNVTTSRFQAFDSPSLDNVISVAAPEGVTQTIERDVYGNPRKISQGGQDKWLFYDSEYRLCRTFEKESKSEMTGYDGAGNVAWSASGQLVDERVAGCAYDLVPAAAKTLRAYDAMNRVTSVVYPSGSLATSFTYDALGNTSSAVAATSTANGNNTGTVTWTYGRNKLGLLTTEILAVDAWNFRLDYDYDGNGVLKSVQYPDGETVAYNPNALGQPTSAGSYASSVSYYPDGAVESYGMGNGASYSASQNTRNLTSNFIYGRGTVLDVSEDLFYDKNANVLGITDRSGSHQRDRAMTYDGLNRLLSADAENLFGKEVYTYDAVNNIRSLGDGTPSGTSTYNYDGDNLLSSITRGGVDQHSFLYDTRGNTINKDGQSLEFDFANRLLSMPGKAAYYMYDASGRRVKKVTPTGTTYYVYNSAGQLMWDLDTGSRIGSDYIYLGRKLIAKSSDSVDKLLPRDVKATLSMIGVPRLSPDGSTIDVTVDIANNGTRVLTSGTQYPVHLGNHIVDGTGSMLRFDVERFDIPDIAPGAHASTTIHMASTAVLGNGRRFQIDLVQEGVSWFQSWGGSILEIGPYSACPTAGTGNLCNNETGLIASQVKVALSYASPPTLSADGQAIDATIDVANNGSVTLAPGGSHPVNLGYYMVEADGATRVYGSLRAAIPEIAPGTHAAVALSFPSTHVVGNGRTLRYVPVQEGIAWLDGLGVTPLVAGPYAKLSGATSSSNGALSLSWTTVPGATTYTLRESFNGGTWNTVQSSSASAWSGSGRVTGTYAYQVQACAAACSGWGSSYTVSVLLPPPTPGSISATAPIAGPVSVTWAASSTASYYSLEYQLNNGGYAIIGNISGTSWSGGVATSGSYNYRVRACNASGCSGFATSSAVNITLPPGSAPSIAGGGNSTSGTYTISWSTVSGATGYNFAGTTNGGGLVGIQYNASTSWTASNLGNATYAYQVQACNAGGCGPWSAQAVVTVTRLPLVPDEPNLRVTGPSRNPVVWVDWHATAYATRYEVVQTNEFGYEVTVYSGTALSMSSLINYNGTLNWKVRACNAVGCSAYGGAAYMTFVSGGGGIDLRTPINDPSISVSGDGQ